MEKSIKNGDQTDKEIIMAKNIKGKEQKQKPDEKRPGAKIQAKGSCQCGCGCGCKLPN
jgi:hypothetical protein